MDKKVFCIGNGESRKNFDLEKAIMFEPQKKIYEFIKKKYSKNKKIKIYNCAISNFEKKQALYINKHDLTTSLTKINTNNKLFILFLTCSN